MKKTNQLRRDRAGQRTFVSSKRQERRKIAAGQVSKLLELSLTNAAKDMQLSQRYAKIAWGVSTRFNVKLREKRRFYCRFCKTFALPSAIRYRFSKRRKALNITCLRCGRTYHKMLLRSTEKFHGR